jgi:hypothetical protein
MRLFIDHLCGDKPPENAGVRCVCKLFVNALGVNKRPHSWCRYSLRGRKCKDGAGHGEAGNKTLLHCGKAVFKLEKEVSLWWPERAIKQKLAVQSRL